MECSSLVGMAFGGQDAVVVFYNFFADGETDACASVLVAGVQPLKYFKYFLFINWFKPNTIVLHANVAIFFCLVGIGFWNDLGIHDLSVNDYARRLVGFRKFQGIVQ